MAQKWQWHNLICGDKYKRKKRAPQEIASASFLRIHTDSFPLKLILSKGYFPCLSIVTISVHYYYQRLSFRNPYIHLSKFYINNSPPSTASASRYEAIGHNRFQIAVLRLHYFIQQDDYILVKYIVLPYYVRI